MTFMKNQTKGTWVTLMTLLLAVISIIVYNVNIAGEGYFQNAAVPKAVSYSIIMIVLLVVVFLLAQVKVTGIAGKILAILCDAIRIIVPVLAIAALMTIVSSRVEGFAFIYFSNEEVLQEVQTAANLSSAHGAIANIALLAITAVVGMISSFFQLKKEQ